VIVVVTIYHWLLCLYPGSYRDEFGEEMTSAFHDARSTLSPALDTKISFYRREFCGLLSGALCAHFDRLFGSGIPFPRCDVQPHFRFPRSTVSLMLVVFAGVVLAIVKASSVAGDTLGSAWRSFVSVLVFMLLTTCTAAAVVWRILHALGRSGMHRLQNVQSRLHSVESNGNR